MWQWLLGILLCSLMLGSNAECGPCCSFCSDGHCFCGHLDGDHCCTNSNCCSGGICVNGGCREKGIYCKSDDDCFYKKCVDNRCACGNSTQTCTQRPYHPVGETCCTPLVCNALTRTSKEGTCGACRKHGQECKAEWGQCCTGGECFYGLCCDKSTHNCKCKGRDQQCVTNAINGACCSGHCNNTSNLCECSKWDEKCLNDGDCCGTKTCKKRWEVCQRRKQTEPCDTNDDCVSRNCVAGTCSCAHYNVSGSCQQTSQCCHGYCDSYYQLCSCIEPMSIYNKPKGPLDCCSGLVNATTHVCGCYGKSHACLLDSHCCSGKCNNGNCACSTTATSSDNGERGNCYSDSDCCHGLKCLGNSCSKPF
eukprot:TRINITY_DN84182_c0_g1_i1.p1 TRINITY_DN84182_c0_g1~~TRINITY_DN84182_c0_g1_i1.p1  ORF type:complete len:364 (+),score=18.95 TRINITY_DN84182_c0_g1_i1:55-1146(+)